MRGTTWGFCASLADRGTEYRAKADHDYQLHLAINDIGHMKTKAKSPQANGICERFRRTILNQFYQTPLPMHFIHFIKNGG